VAFARPGKPSKIGFGGQIRALPAPGGTAGLFTILQRFLKPAGDKEGARGQWNGRSNQEAGRAQIAPPARVDHLDGGFAARQCVVQDMSTSGAMITVDDPSVLPGRLRLAFARDARTGRNCAVVWRRGKSLGVKFVR